MIRNLSLALALVATAGVAGAQPPRPDLDSLFAAADANHDGVITRAEFIASRSARFATLDRNGDGFLSRADVPQALLALHPGAPRLTQMLDRFDANHDGKASRDEFVAGSLVLFDQADANHDGVVTRAEAAAALTRWRAAAAPQG